MQSEYILTLLVIGFIAGFLANAIAGGRGGIAGNIFVGLLGAVFGSFLAELLGIPFYGIIADIVVATVGAVILLAMFSAYNSRRPI